MGLFFVPILVRNWQNRFIPAEQRGQDVSCEALVDSGAVELCLPAEQIELLRLVQVGTIETETATGAHQSLRIMGMAEVEVQGRTAQVRVIELPRGARPMLGAVPLEEMDWHISPKEQRLVPNPRSPEGPVLLLT
jgi:clan AA aspartic protease